MINVEKLEAEKADLEKQLNEAEAGEDITAISTRIGQINTLLATSKEKPKSTGTRYGLLPLTIVALLVAIAALFFPRVSSREEIPTDIVTEGAIRSLEESLNGKIREIGERMDGLKPGKTVGLDKAAERRLANLERHVGNHSVYIAKQQGKKKPVAVKKPKPDPVPVVVETPKPSVKKKTVVQQPVEEKKPVVVKETEKTRVPGEPGQGVTLTLEASETVARIFFNRTWPDEGYRSGSDPVFPNVPPSTYRINAESETGLWSADAASLARGSSHFDVMVNGVKMVTTEDNGEGGANFVFTVNPDGTISQ